MPSEAKRDLEQHRAELRVLEYETEQAQEAAAASVEALNTSNKERKDAATMEEKRAAEAEAAAEEAAAALMQGNMEREREQAVQQKQASDAHAASTRAAVNLEHAVNEEKDSVSAQTVAAEAATKSLEPKPRSWLRSAASLGLRARRDRNKAEAARKEVIKLLHPSIILATCLTLHC